MYAPNANWTAAIAARTQVPRYFVRIEGLGVDYSTGPVRNPTVTKVQLMSIPKGGGVSLDILKGSRTIQEVTFELEDKDGQISAWVATEAPGAPLATVINVAGTIYGGYAHLDETDYPPIYPGLLRNVERNSSNTGFIFTLASPLALMFGKDIMLNAGEVDDPANPGNKIAKPSTVRGNPINVVYSLMTGDFGNATFPVEHSNDGGFSSLPTGMGISPSRMDTARLLLERDTWFPYYPDENDAQTTPDLVFTGSENGLRYLEDQFFRTFLCVPTLSQGGKIGIKKVTFAFAQATIQEVNLDHIIDVKGWHRAIDLHLNEFEFWGDFDGDPRTSPAPTDQYATSFDVQEPEDASDQTATQEKINYKVEAKWVASANDGALIALDQIGRVRALFEKTPALMTLVLNFRRRNVEEGDVISVTHPDILDLLTGAVGVTNKAMLVLSISPDFEKGTINALVLDGGFTRFGVYSGDGQADFDVATDLERNTYAFMTNDAGTMADGSPGYRFA